MIPARAGVEKNSNTVMENKSDGGKKSVEGKN